MRLVPTILQASLSNFPSGVPLQNPLCFLSWASHSLRSLTLFCSLDTSNWNLPRLLASEGRFTVHHLSSSLLRHLEGLLLFLETAVVSLTGSYRPSCGSFLRASTWKHPNCLLTTQEGERQLRSFHLLGLSIVVGAYHEPPSADFA